MTQFAANQLELVLKGPYSDLDTLIGCRFFSRDLKLHQKNSALSLLTGPNKTNFRGRGIEFEEVRAYQAGDDIRTIDWRVTARSNNAYTKLFREERERPVLVVCDQSQSMFFGSESCFKSVMASYISSVIAWAALNNGDRIGGLVFGNDGHNETRPRRNRQTVLHLIHQLLEYNKRLKLTSAHNHEDSNRLEKVLIDLRRIAKPGSAIYIISDFYNFNNNTKKQLHHLSKHCEVTAFYIYDRLEEKLPPSGQYAVTDGANELTIFTGKESYRNAYESNFKQTYDEIRQHCSKSGIPLIPIKTSDKPLRILHKYFGKGKN